MRRRGSVSFTARNGVFLVGLAVAVLGLVEGLVGVAQFKRPNLWTHTKLSDLGAVKDASLHSIALGGAALVVGVLIGLVGIWRSRRAQLPSAGATERAAEPASRTITLDRPVLESMPQAPGGPLSPMAERVWERRLAIDLQQQRLMKGSFGPESRIDADLYVLALRQLVHAVRAAQMETRSSVIARALTTFGKIAGGQDDMLVAIEATANGGSDPKQDAVGLSPAGDDIVIGHLTLPAQMVTAAAGVLANTTIGDLTNIRSRALTRKPPKRAVAERTSH